MATTAVVDGRLVIVTKGWDHTLRVWDPVTGTQIGDPLADDARAHALVTTTSDHRPVVVTGEWHEGRGRLRTWDLTTGRQLGSPLVFPERISAVAATPQGVLVVGFGNDVGAALPQ
jgi:hypothetical protein